MYPQKLIDYLHEQESEGAEIFTTSISDATIFIIKHTAHPWICYVEWYEAEEEYTMVNIAGKAMKRLRMVIDEYEND